jgi:hypothetical protein
MFSDWMFTVGFPRLLTIGGHLAVECVFQGGRGVLLWQAISTDLRWKLVSKVFVVSQTVFVVPVVSARRQGDADLLTPA